MTALFIYILSLASPPFAASTQKVAVFVWANSYLVLFIEYIQPWEFFFLLFFCHKHLIQWF